MGLLDQVLGAVSGATAQPGAGGSAALPELVLHWLNDPKTGGISGLVQSFHQGGLGEVVTSWVGNGQNLPISADQIQAVLGSETVQRFAAQLGLNPSDVSGKLAQYLPQIIDTLTPNGQVPQGGGNLVAEGMSLLKSVLG
jgi:uncharacterized protein YidB (DUF937 family)